MRNRFVITILMLSFSLFVSAQKYKVKNVEHQRLTIDATQDRSNPNAEAFMLPFKAKVDSIMSPIVGYCARDMRVEQPESEMSNLLSDILVWIAENDFNEPVAFAVYNMGGIRATFSKGPISIGNVVDVAPFENKICFMTLKGTDVIELFTQMAHRLGEGVSHGVELTITKEGKLVDAKLHGKEIDPEENYRVATIDYLIEGNDGMPALRKGTDLVAPKDKNNDTRFLIMEYFRAKQANGEVVDAQIEGRTKIIE